jgi:2-hydroxychromene-2-carboxylate isomerase
MTPIFLFDFGSPNAYLAHRVLPQIEARTGVRFDYLPILLGGLFKLTGNQSPITAYAQIPAKLAYENLEMQRFIRRHDIPFRMNPHFPINTLGLMRGAVAAQAEGVAAPYVETIFRFMWEAPRNLGDAGTFKSALAEAGLPAERLLARMQDQAVKDRLMANTQFAFERGAFGAPSFLVGDDLYFGKDRLAQVEDAIRSAS